MRFLIVSAAILAYAAAAPSGALLAGSYSHGFAAHGLAHGYASPLAVAHAAPLAVAHGPALPTISPGDLHGAAIEAHVDASDHVRASVDATRELHDQASEIHGQAINAAEDHSWQAIDAVKTAEAQLDGQAAGVAPILAKQLVGHAAPVVSGYAGYAGHGLAAGYAGHGLAAGYAGHGLAVGHAAYAAPAYGASKTVVQQSLSQSHPGAVLHAAPVAYAAHGLAGHGLAGHGYAGHGYAGHGFGHY